MAHNWFVWVLQWNFEAVRILHHHWSNHIHKTKIHQTQKPLRKGRNCCYVHLLVYWWKTIFVWHGICSAYTLEMRQVIQWYEKCRHYVHYPFSSPYSNTIATCRKDEVCALRSEVDLLLQQLQHYISTASIVQSPQQSISLPSIESSPFLELAWCYSFDRTCHCIQR